MLRWARGGFSLGSVLPAAGLLFAAQNFSIIAAAVGLLSPVNTILSVVNFLVTMLFTHLAFKKMGSGETALLYPVHQVFAALETIVFFLSFLITPAVVWKKRSV
jgi:energy-converting hydrogenase Eha subunit C